jgi:hypothetical protein
MLKGWFRGLDAIYTIGRYLQAKEAAMTSHGPGGHHILDATDLNFLEMSWILNSRTVILWILEQIAALAFAEPQQSRVSPQLGIMWIFQLSLDGLSRKEMIEHNLSMMLDCLIGWLLWVLIFPAIMRSSLTKFQLLDELLSQNDLERLLLDLLDKEDTFERELAVEHVEDKIINKQMAVYDEESLAQSTNSGNATEYLLTQHKSGSKAGAVEDKLYKTFEEMSLINRTRRNFRLLRDWQGKRPW